MTLILDGQYTDGNWADAGIGLAEDCRRGRYAKMPYKQTIVDIEGTVTVGTF